MSRVEHVWNFADHVRQIIIAHIPPLPLIIAEIPSILHKIHESIKSIGEAIGEWVL